MSAVRPCADADSTRPRIVILYHFFPPDDVVSAQQFGGLARGLAERGWEVEAIVSARFCHGEGLARPARECWHGVRIRRLWRPGLRQDRGRGRILNALWMLFAWSLLALRRGRRQPHVALCGTDPVFSAVVAGLLKRLRPGIRQAHWAFDLYPEAAVADELLREDSRVVRAARKAMRWAYAAFDLIVDIGPRMRERIAAYGPQRRHATLTPWALAEPAAPPRADPEVRLRLFGPCRLALLYSGSFGRAHEFREFLELARRLRGKELSFGFAARGRRLDELKAALTPADTNVRLLPFASEQELERHLAAADVHLASLRANWTGIVVPSKFFGSLAIGRPVLFAGDPTSDLAMWIREENVGWSLTQENLESTAAALLGLAERPEALEELQRRCWETYQRRFSRKTILDRFDRELRALLPQRRPEAAAPPQDGPKNDPADGKFAPAARLNR